LDKYKDKWDDVLEEFQTLRKPDNDAIAQLALDNFVEMRDLVADEDFLLRKQIEARIHDLYPNEWIPLYSMVTFEETMRYSDAMSIGKLQNQVMSEVMQMEDIKSNWERLDFQDIVNRLTSLKN
jgi:kynurenine 3-monooxygenase